MLRFLLAALVAAPAIAQVPCEVRVVVLGSSNAAGQGPAHRDSTWVNRLRESLRMTHAGSRVLNYARNGYTTFHLLPTDAPDPDGPAPDPRHNVDQALALGADAVVLSLTSNDGAREVPVVRQLARLDAIRDALGDVPLWVTTTTPRSGGISDAGRAIQRAVRDATLARYGDRAVDFWTGIGDETGVAVPGMGQGDGVHFTDAAHRLFFRRVRAALGGWLAETCGG